MTAARNLAQTRQRIDRIAGFAQNPACLVDQNRSAFRSGRLERGNQPAEFFEFCPHLLQRTGNAEDADDLLQETFIKVYMNLHRYSPEYTFGQWLYTIARNTFIDYVRKRQDDLPIDEKFSSPASNTPTPEESVINSQQRHQIELCIARLPENYRRLIRMRFFDEYSYEEIAVKLSLPLGTVKTQIHRARERMCRLIVENDNR